MRTQIMVLLLLLMFAGSAMAIEADTNTRLDPHPDHISFYNNSTYITCNYTVQEAANVTIIFEKEGYADYKVEALNWTSKSALVKDYRHNIVMEEE